MPLPVGKDVIAQRLRDYPRDHYLYIGAIMKGVALSVATLVLMQICVNIRDEWPRATPWLVSLAAILVSYLTWGRGVLITNSRSSVWDSILPLLMGIAEFMLFAVLWIDSKHPWIECNWFLMIALHGYLAALLVNNRIRNSKVAEDFDQETQPLGTMMERWIHKDRLGAFAVGTAGLVCWLIIRIWLLPYHGYRVATITQAFIAIPMGLVLCKVIVDADRERQAIDQFISNADRPTETDLV